MSSFFVKQGTFFKPVDDLDFDPSHPYFDDCLVYIPLIRDLRALNYITGLESTVLQTGGGFPSEIFTKQGRAVKQDGTSANRLLGYRIPQIPLAANESFTCLMGTWIHAFGPDQGVYSLEDDQNPGSWLDIFASNTAYRMSAFTTYSSYTIDSLGYWSGGLVWHQDGTIEFVNYGDIDVSSRSRTYAANPLLNVFCTTGSAGKGIQGSDFGGTQGNTTPLWFYFFRGALPHARIREISERPFAPFAPKIWVPVGPAGPVVITGTGALQAQDAAVSGVGTVIVEAIEGAGTLQADNAAVAGAGAIVQTGTGALQADDTSVAGAGIQIFDGTGTLQAGSASVVGFGAIVQDGTGTLQAQDAAVSGAGELGDEKAGAGALQAQPAVVSGVGLRIPAGTGALVAADAAVSGTGLTEGLISGTGVLQASDAAVQGAGEFAFTGTGALQAQPAAAAGSGFLLGELTLTEADLAAIQDVVWAKLVNEGLVAQINELWQRRGLDAANPQTYDKAGNQIRVGNITIDLTGDPSSVTQTRQP